MRWAALPTEWSWSLPGAAEKPVVGSLREGQVSRAVIVSRTGTDRTVVTKIESRARVVERSYRVA